MKILISAVAMIALSGFAGAVQAKDAKPAKEHPGHPGHFIKLEEKEKDLVYKGGAKGKGEEHTIPFDDETKFSIDGKDTTEADFKKEVKKGEYIEIHEKKLDPKGDKTKVIATAVEAFTVQPEPTTAPTTAPAK